MRFTTFVDGLQTAVDTRQIAKYTVIFLLIRVIVWDMEQ
jgi:hypothetical protein